MFIGGILVAICFGLGMPLIIALVGIAYVIDALSVVIQVASVKIRKKRIFKMTPIHHSFEISGHSENGIVVIFSVITVIGCVAAIAAAMFYSGMFA
jgi:phospho-N-acetylmuramoyl-pentapeptide-transferase